MNTASVLILLGLTVGLISYLCWRDAVAEAEMVRREEAAERERERIQRAMEYVFAKRYDHWN